MCIQQEWIFARIAKIDWWRYYNIFHASYSSDYKSQTKQDKTKPNSVHSVLIDAFVILMGKNRKLVIFHRQLIFMWLWMRPREDALSLWYCELTCISSQVYLFNEFSEFGIFLERISEWAYACYFHADCSLTCPFFHNVKRRYQRLMVSIVCVFLSLFLSRSNEEQNQIHDVLV